MRKRTRETLPRKSSLLPGNSYPWTDGGIATGKSSAADIFRKQGLFVLDADQLVKEVYAEDESIRFVQDLDARFVSEGNINFPLLRSWAFESKDNISTLEGFYIPS